MKGRSRILREELGGEISWEGENNKKIREEITKRERDKVFNSFSACPLPTTEAIYIYSFT